MRLFLTQRSLPLLIVLSLQTVANSEERFDRLDSASFPLITCHFANPIRSVGEAYRYCPNHFEESEVVVRWAMFKEEHIGAAHELAVYGAKAYVYFATFDIGREGVGVKRLAEQTWLMMTDIKNALAYQVHGEDEQYYYPPESDLFRAAARGEKLVPMVMKMPGQAADATIGNLIRGDFHRFAVEGVPVILPWALPMLGGPAASASEVSGLPGVMTLATNAGSAAGSISFSSPWVAGVIGVAGDFGTGTLVLGLGNQALSEDRAPTSGGPITNKTGAKKLREASVGKTVAELDWEPLGKYTKKELGDSLDFFHLRIKKILKDAYERNRVAGNIPSRPEQWIYARDLQTFELNPKEVATLSKVGKSATDLLPLKRIIKDRLEYLESRGLDREGRYGGSFIEPSSGNWNALAREPNIEYIQAFTDYLAQPVSTRGPLPPALASYCTLWLL